MSGCVIIDLQTETKPNSKEHEMKTYAGWFVDQAGNVCSTQDTIEDCHFEFIDQGTFIEVHIVVTETDEVFEEYVLHFNLDALYISMES